MGAYMPQAGIKPGLRVNVYLNLTHHSATTASLIDLFAQIYLTAAVFVSLMWSRDLDSVSRMSQSLSRDFDKLFFKLLLATFSKIASRDLDKYLLRSVILSRQVWHDLLELAPPLVGPR